MNTLASALGKDFIKHKEEVRIRSFELGGHTFRVKVPLTAEFEVMQKRMKAIDEAMVDKYYKELTQGFENFKDEKKEGVEILENDILIDGRSMRDAARNKLIAEQRILELFKLLVPEEKGFDMQNITYPMIEELFPFPIQMKIIEEISRVVSVQYEEAKGK